MEKRTFTRLALGLIGVAVIFSAGNVLPYYLRSTAFMRQPFVQFIITLASYALSTAILFFATRGLPRMTPRPKRKMSFGQTAGFFCVNRGVAMVLSLVGIVVMLIFVVLLKGMSGLSEYAEQMNFLPTAAWNPSMWYNMFSICILAPLVEELMFRKLLMNPLRPFGDKMAVLYTGISFGLLHMNIQQLFYTTCLGLFLGYILIRTENIWYCVIQHFLLNTSSFLLLPLAERIASGDTQVLVISVILLVGILAVSAVGIVLFFIYVRRTKWEASSYSFSRPIGARLAVFSGWGWVYVLICLAVPVWSILL